MFKAFLRVGFYFFIMCPGISSAVEVIKIKPDERLVLGSSERTNKIRTIEKDIELIDVDQITSATFKFKVVERSRCPVSYFPTEIFVNSSKIGEINFQDLSVGDVVEEKFGIGKGILKTGLNKFKIVAGICDLSFDSLLVNNLSIQ